jgi:ERCC4-type nuclease
MSQINAIMIDNREPEFFQRLKFGGVPTMVIQLETGDVQAVTDDGCTLVFERKTPSDFLNTLKEDRLFPQLARMTELRNAQLYGESLNYWPYLIVTGQFLPGSDGKVVADGRVTGWSFASVMGTLLSIQEMGVFVVFCNGDMDYENAILRIGKRDRNPETKIFAPRPARTLGPKIDFLTGIPGIGIEHAQSILQWSGDNVAHALIGLTDMEIKSPVGLNLRRRFRDLLGLQDCENFEITGTQITEPILKG